MRKIKFVNNEYYYIYNRGVDKQNIFCDKKDYLRFLINLRLFNNNSKKEKRDFILRNKQNLDKEPSFGYPKLGS